MHERRADVLLCCCITDKYIMKNVPSVAAKLSSRALNCRRHNGSKWQLADFIECIAVYQIVEFTCPALLKFSYWDFASPNHCNARQIDAGFHTQQNVHSSNLRSTVSGRVTTVKSGCLGLKFKCVVGFGVVVPQQPLLHRPSLA